MTLAKLQTIPNFLETREDPHHLGMRKHCDVSWLPDRSLLITILFQPDHLIYTKV